MNALAFELPSALEAHEPPEARGLGRDQVRLLVARPGDQAIAHARFAELPALLDAGDLLVVNVSATLPAAVDATRGPDRVRVHFSTRAPHLDPSWRVVELRAADGLQPGRGHVGETLALPGEATLELVAPYASGARLMLARMRSQHVLERYLRQYGKPIRYSYLARELPLECYQNVYASIPGSAEMPSAGRPFTPELLTTLIGRGVLIAPVTLHAGVSSPERDEPPFPEWFEVPAQTADAVNAAHRRGARVIAVGTTVVRALETVTDPDGATAGTGWTGLLVTPDRPLRAVDGLITGWHEPQASHLLMLEALAGPELLARSYEEALRAGYLWHEFGDSHLILH